MTTRSSGVSDANTARLHVIVFRTTHWRVFSISSTEAYDRTGGMPRAASGYGEEGSSTPPPNVPATSSVPAGAGPPPPAGAGEGRVAEKLNTRGPPTSFS